MQVRTGDRVDSGVSLFATFEQAASRYPQQVAFKALGGHGRSYTYSEVAQTVKRLACGLSRGDFAGVTEIGLLAENRPEWGIAYFAIVASGKTVVPIDANLKQKEIAYIIQHAKLSALFTSSKYENALSETYQNLRIISFDSDPVRSWSNIMNPDVSSWKNRAADTAVLIYTSGTTGDPKAVRLTHRNLLANFEGIRAVLEFNETDVFLSVLPLHHTFEATCGFLLPLFSGSSIVYARSLKSKDILEDLAFNRVTLMCGVPLLYEKMHNSIRRGIQAAPFARRALFRLLFFVSAAGWAIRRKWGKTLFASLRNKAGLGSIRMFVSGGAAIPPQISRFFNLIGFDFQQGYGLTECSPVISVNYPDDTRFGSVGPPLQNVEVRIYEPDRNGIGEIIVRGENVTPGYKDNAEGTANLLKDGWLFTGDMGKIKDGHLWITGRKKNIIVSAAGKNIYPEQIEEKLLESPYILECVVFARKKKNGQGEEVSTIIVPDMEQLRVDVGISPDNPDLGKIDEIIKSEVSSINHHMADYKRISNVEVRLEELEKTSTKKVKRFIY